jgi:Actin
MEQIFFEEYQAASFARFDRRIPFVDHRRGIEGVLLCLAATLSAFKYERQSESDYVLVVDSGYSFTHIIPFYQGRKLVDGMIR